jgi:hypothetical protein
MKLRKQLARADLAPMQVRRQPGGPAQIGTIASTRVGCERFSSELAERFMRAVLAGRPVFMQRLFPWFPRQEIEGA